MAPIQRILIVIGAVTAVVGLAWPWLARLGLGRLPGDILVRRGGFTFYAPIVTCLAVSIVLSLIFRLVRRGRISRPGPRPSPG